MVQGREKGFGRVQQEKGRQSRRVIAEEKGGFAGRTIGGPERESGGGPIKLK